MIKPMNLVFRERNWFGKLRLRGSRVFHIAYVKINRVKVCTKVKIKMHPFAPVMHPNFRINKMPEPKYTQSRKNAPTHIFSEEMCYCIALHVCRHKHFLNYTPTNHQFPQISHLIVNKVPSDKYIIILSSESFTIISCIGRLSVSFSTSNNLSLISFFSILSFAPDISVSGMVYL